MASKRNAWLAVSLCLIQAAWGASLWQPGFALGKRHEHKKKLHAVDEVEGSNVVQNAARTKWILYKRAGDAAYESGNYVLAEEQFRNAAKESETFGVNDKRHATTIYNLALVLQSEDKYSEAEGVYQQAAALIGKAYGENSDRLGQVYEQLAELRKVQDDIKDAENYYLKSLAINEKVYGNDKPEMAQALDSVAEFYEEQEIFDKAEPLYRRALDISRATIGAESLETAKREAHFAEFFFIQGKFAVAEPLFASALRISDKVSGPDSVDSGKIAYDYADFYYEQGQFAQAVPLYQRAIAIAKSHAPADVAMMESCLGNTFDRLGNYAEAEKQYQDALARLAKNPDQPVLLECLKHYQRHFNLQMKKDEAAKISARIREVRAAMLIHTPASMQANGAPPGNGTKAEPGIAAPIATAAGEADSGADTSESAGSPGKRKPPRRPFAAQVQVQVQTTIVGR